MDRFADLLRHGEPEGGPRFRGTADQGLTRCGVVAMQRTVAAAGSVWDLILTSPARRCAGFAEHLAHAHGLPLEVWGDLRERDWGDWEGCTASGIPAADLDRFWTDPEGFTPPGAEPLATFSGRVLAAWQRLLGHSARRPLVITHGGVLRVVLGAVLELPAASLPLIEVPYACLSRLRLPSGAGRPSLVAHGPWPPGQD
jgi:alpha-ribazole phosphatase